MLSSDKFLYYNFYMVTYIYQVIFIYSRLAKNFTFFCQNLYSYCLNSTTFYATLKTLFLSFMSTECGAV